MTRVEGLSRISLAYSGIRTTVTYPWRPESPPTLRSSHLGASIPVKIRKDEKGFPDNPPPYYPPRFPPFIHVTDGCIIKGEPTRDR